MFVNYRSDAEGARAVVEQIAAAGGAAVAVQADVSVRAEVEAMYATIEAAHGFVRLPGQQRRRHAGRAADADG